MAFHRVIIIREYDGRVLAWSRTSRYLSRTACILYEANEWLYMNETRQLDVETGRFNYSERRITQSLDSLHIVNVINGTSIVSCHTTRSTTTGSSAFVINSQYHFTDIKNRQNNESDKRMTIHYKIVSGQILDHKTKTSLKSFSKIISYKLIE